MAEQLRLVRLNHLISEEERKLMQSLAPTLDVEAAEMLLAYRGEKVIGFVIALDVDTRNIVQMMEPPLERSARISGVSAIKSAERMDDLLPDSFTDVGAEEDGPPTVRLGIPGRKKI